MDALTITQNDDGTLTLSGGLADPVFCSAELYADLEASEHVVVDAGQPDVTYVSITCTNYWLQYLVKSYSQSLNGYVLELAGYAEL